MKVNRTALGCSGATLGAIVLTAVQFGYCRWFADSSGVVTSNSFAGETALTRGYTLLVLLACASPLLGAFLGTSSLLCVASFLKRDIAYLAETWDFAVTVFSVAAGTWMICLLVPILASGLWRERLLAAVALLALNAPMQWLLALVILAKTALNRLRAEEKRARYDAQAQAHR